MSTPAPKAPLVEIGDRSTLTPAHFAAVRNDGLSFLACIDASAGNPDLVKEFDRLNGTNLARRGAPLDLAIDDATGRTHADLAQFLCFVWNFVFLRTGPIIGR